MPIIPFYGAERSDLFAIERRAMDRPGKVVAALDRHLPDAGVVLDIGAGDGFTAERLTTPTRRVIPVEPAAGMIRPDRALPWVRADAEHLPFAAASVDAAYATWAYFFPYYADPSPGLAELHRVVKPGGRLLVVDNLGGDEFTALASQDLTADRAWWAERGFRCEVIDTVFAFDDLDDARVLLGFYFGGAAKSIDRTELSFRVGLFVGRSAGGHRHAATEMLSGSRAAAALPPGRRGPPSSDSICGGARRT